MAQGKQEFEVQAAGGNSADHIVKFANVQLTALPTADPHVVGQLYNDSGTVKVSAG